jgi:hypothetical protein
MKLTKKSQSVLQYADMAEPVGSPEQPSTQFDGYAPVPNPEQLRSSIRFSGMSAYSAPYPNASTSSFQFTSPRFPDESSSTIAFAHTIPFAATATAVNLPTESTAYLADNASIISNEKPEIVLDDDLRNALAQHNHRSDQDAEDFEDEEEEEEYNYPGAGKLAIIMASLYISIFLMALDRTIIGVAVPRITNEFHSIDDIGWYVF